MSDYAGPIIVIIGIVGAILGLSANRADHQHEETMARMCMEHGGNWDRAECRK